MTENEAIKILTLSEEEQKEFPNLKEIYAIAVKALEEVQQYRVIGTVEQCREAVRLQKQKKIRPGYRDVDEPLCPYCDKVLKHEDICECGQRIDWSDIPEKENT